MSYKQRFTLVVLIVLIMFILHNSFFLWRFDAVLPILFGFMPFAFYYYIAYAILALLAMKVIIIIAWPDPPAGLFDEQADKERSE